MYNIFSLCEDKHKFVYEVCPGLFDGDALTIEELEYWIVYSLISTCKIEGLDIGNSSYKNANSKLRSHRQKQKERMRK